MKTFLFSDAGNSERSCTIITCKRPDFSLLERCLRSHRSPKKWTSATPSYCAVCVTSVASGRSSCARRGPASKYEASSLAESSQRRAPSERGPAVSCAELWSLTGRRRRISYPTWTSVNPNSCRKADTKNYRCQRCNRRMICRLLQHNTSTPNINISISSNTNSNPSKTFHRVALYKCSKRRLSNNSYNTSLSLLMACHRLLQRKGELTQLNRWARYFWLISEWLWWAYASLSML